MLLLYYDNEKWLQNIFECKVWTWDLSRTTRASVIDDISGVCKRAIVAIRPQNDTFYTHSHTLSLTYAERNRKRDGKIELMLKIDIKSRETWCVYLPWKEIKFGCYYYFDQLQLFFGLNILRVKMRSGCLEQAFICAFELITLEFLCIEISARNISRLQDKSSTWVPMIFK